MKFYLVVAAIRILGFDFAIDVYYGPKEGV